MKKLIFVRHGKAERMVPRRADKGPVERLHGGAAITPGGRQQFLHGHGLTRTAGPDRGEDHRQRQTDHDRQAVAGQ